MNVYRIRMTLPAQRARLAPVLVSCLGFLALTGGPGAAVAQDPPADPADQIQRLGADTYQARQTAMQNLVQTGLEALPHLAEAAHSGDPEIRIRVMTVLARLAIANDDATRSAAQAIIEELTGSLDADTARLARQTWSGLGRLLQDSAMQRLQGLGAEVAGHTLHGDFYSANTLEVLVGPDWRGSRADLNSLRWLVDLSSVTLIGPDIDDELIQSISELPNLQNVVVKRASITNQSMGSFSKMKSLHRLQLVYCQLDDGCLDQLARFADSSRGVPGLPEILLYGTGLSREAVDRLQNETGLQVDLRKGAFLGIYFNQGDGPCEITRVVAGSAAELGGFQVGDVVLEFAGRQVVSGNEFRGAVSQYSPGDQISVLVRRGSESMELNIELGRFPDLDQ